jgi:hypothetical protein
MDLNEDLMHKVDFEPSYRYLNFFQPVSRVTWWQAAV